MQKTICEKEFLTVSDVKQFLGISQAKAYELTHSKGFPVCKIGSSIRVPRTAFMAWVKVRTYIPKELEC